MKHEMGSDFEFDDALSQRQAGDYSWLPHLGGDLTLTFSGRGAIELAIQDMRERRQIETVYMPAYCCDSMTAPFIKNELDILFYDVTYEKETGLTYHIDPNADVDLFFAMSYFGLGDDQLDDVIKTFKSKNKMIIEDVTHRLLSTHSHGLEADYLVASLRKSIALPTGGYTTKADGAFFKKPDKSSDINVEEKIAAMKEKQAYLKGEQIDKQAFLAKFAAFNQAVALFDETYKIDHTSRDLLSKFDIKSVQAKRRENARVLYDGIEKYDNIKPLIPNPDLTDACPIFVPVMLSTTEARNDLRQALIAEQIYCPVHWPQATTVNDIWPKELSLICDQRYTTADMERLLRVIDSWQKTSTNEE